MEPEQIVLEIIGVSHTNVHHRQLLHLILSWLAREYATAPLFVAVEYDSGHFQKIVNQRPEVRRKASDRWPQFPERVLDIMAASIGFEGDAHLSVFPGSKTLWLDEGRQGKDAEVGRIGEYLLGRYADYLSRADRTEDASEILAALDLGSRFNSRGSVEDWVPGDRDRIWAERVSQELSLEGWAIAVVGANHTRTVKGSLRALLEERGFQLKVTSLC